MRKLFIDWAGDIGIAYKNLKQIRSKKSQFNNITIANSKSLGKLLILGGEVQHVESYEFLYHEPLIHLPTAFLADPQKALIIGGGSLNALRELLKYKSFKRILMVEIDRQVIDIMIETNPLLENLILDKRVTILNDEGYEYLTRTEEKFDLIINDAADLTRLSKKLNIIKVMHEHLTEIGICADVIYRHLFEKKTTRKMLSLLNEIDCKIFSLIFVPEYPGTLHILALWGKNPKLKLEINIPYNEEQLQWKLNGANPCKYYDPKFLKYFLYLPGYFRDYLISTSKKPLFETQIL